MTNIEWRHAFETISPYIVKITTPIGMGTGFLVGYSKNGELCGIATAAHVLDYANIWEQPIRIKHYHTGKEVMLNEKTRVIHIDNNLDTAIIVCVSMHFDFPKKVLGLIPAGLHLPIGNEVGWTGFPALSPKDLCLFSGRISCWHEDEGEYLADGVAINGVSGGPAFFIQSDGEMAIIGVVSAYIPNRATGEVLPGLCVLRDVKQLQDIVKELSSFERAKKEENIPVIKRKKEKRKKK